MRGEIKIDKFHVMKVFSKAAATYDESSPLQGEVLTRLASLIERILEPRAILDIGCGTGNMLLELKGRFPTASLTGVDLAPGMLKRAVEKFLDDPSPGFVNTDMESLPFSDASFDLITSSLAFQWADDIDAALAESARVLKPGGSLFFSTFSKGTFSELKEVFSASAAAMMEFLSSVEVKAALERKGFEIVRSLEEEVKKEYNDLFDLLRRLRGIGAASPFPTRGLTLSRGAGLKEAARLYCERFSAPTPTGGDGAGAGIVATYNILYIAARRLG